MVNTTSYESPCYVIFTHQLWLKITSSLQQNSSLFRDLIPIPTGKAHLQVMNRTDYSLSYIEMHSTVVCLLLSVTHLTSCTSTKSTRKLYFSSDPPYLDAFSSISNVRTHPCRGDKGNHLTWVRIVCYCFNVTSSSYTCVSANCIELETNALQ
jgi:hypothetical protein